MADSSPGDSGLVPGWARTHFGTDGVRGIVGETLTPDLVERLGRAVTLWAGGAEMLVGRDTRASGPELERALVRGIVEAGGTAVLGGVLPTPTVALLAGDRLGLVLSASHNPAEYNGVKVFHRGGKLVDREEAEIEALLDTPGPGGGSVVTREDAVPRYVEHVVSHFGSDLTGLRVAVDCANGAFSGIAPAVFEQLGAQVTAIGNAPDGTNINLDCGATDLRMLADTVRAGSYDLGIAFDGDGDRMLAVDAAGETVDGDQIIAICALALGVDLVAVTSMTNLGFHRLMSDHGIRVLTTDVGDRYVLEALRREGGVLGGEQSGHVIALDGHVTGDGLAAALLLCRSLAGRSLAEAAAVMPRYAQVQENVHVADRALSDALRAEVARINEELGDRGRVLVRPSGTEPLVRVLAEAADRQEAADLCARVAHLVRQGAGAG